MGRIPEADDDYPQMERLAAVVQAAVLSAGRRWTARDLERSVAAREDCPRTLVRKAIRSLIDSEILEYRYTFGQSYLVMSLRRPVEVGDRFTIIPPRHLKDFDDILRLPLAIAPGGAFGSGRHPTTRIALEALEAAWAYLFQKDLHPVRAAIDIGTGSGILAIAAARLGARKVTALDIDACARTEARQNIALNTGMSNVAVSDQPLASVRGRFALVMANLRLPTLVQLAGWIEAHLHTGGCIVVSGLRDAEWGRLVSTYGARKMQPVWHKSNAGWAGGVFSLWPGEIGKETLSKR